MKESRFIELLNLYVDHELSAAEAAELEAEITANPARRRTYQQYCRMQKACTQLFETAREEAPASPLLQRSLEAADEKIVSFPERSRRQRERGVIIGWSAAAGLAACIALLAVTLVRREVTEPAPLLLVSASTAPAPSVGAAPTVERVNPVAGQLVAVATNAEFRPVFSTQTFMLGRAAVDTETPVPASDHRFDWLASVELTPLQRAKVAEASFQTRPVLAPADSAVFTNGKDFTADQAEYIGFQLQK